MARIRELVLTGGPCAGKTTAIARLADALPTHGWRVLRAPEAATMFLTGGVDDLAAVAADPGRYSRFQLALTGACANLRASFRSMAEALGDDTLIVYDRAEPDTAAYVDPEAYRDVTARLGTTPEAVCDSYDMVLHLVTAADGAEWAYTTANNAARSETPEQARERDRATLAAWFGHPRLVVIDNRSDFEAKMARVVDAALRLLGEPMALEIERKYLLASAPDLDRLAATGPVVTSEITQIYLPSPEGTERRCRRTVCDGAVTYTLTEKRPAGSDEVRHEEERLVGYDVWADAVAGGGATVRRSPRPAWCSSTTGSASSSTSSTAPARDGCWRSGSGRSTTRCGSHRSSTSPGRSPTTRPGATLRSPAPPELVPGGPRERQRPPLAAARAGGRPTVVGGGSPRGGSVVAPAGDGVVGAGRVRATHRTSTCCLVSRGFVQVRTPGKPSYRFLWRHSPCSAGRVAERLLQFVACVPTVASFNLRVAVPEHPNLALRDTPSSPLPLWPLAGRCLPSAG